jgi:hypothetical protein
MKEILPVAEIMHRLVTETEAALSQAVGLSLRPPRMARVVPGRRPAHFSGSTSGSRSVSQPKNTGCRYPSAVARLIW